MRFAKLAKDLSAIYPCEIKIHICDDALFSGLPRLNGNYLTYFRFFIPRLVPKNCAVCLYLDIDMLVVGDLRELFALDMGDKCVGVVNDYAHNSIKLPFAFNLLVRAYICAICKGESMRYKFDFTRSAMNLALKNPVVWHFAGNYKPWSNAWIMNEKGRILSEIWWEVALKTPQFGDILQSEFERLNANGDKIYENRIAIYLLKCVKNPLGFLTLPFVVAKVFGKNKQEILKMREFGESCDLHKLSPSDYNFAFELFYLCQKSWHKRKKGDLLILPLKAIKLKIRHNRYGIARIS